MAYYLQPGDAVEDCAAVADHVLDNTDCDDSESTAYPGAPEVYDSLDNDCNSLIDDDDPGSMARKQKHGS